MIRIFTNLMILIAVGCLAEAVCAAEFSAEQHALLAKCTWKSANDQTLPYRLYTPKLEAGKKYPLIVFLHGAGERGDNNEAQFIQDHFLNLILGAEAKNHPAYLIAPQCANGKRWCEVDWSIPDTHVTPVEPSEGMRMVHEIVQFMIQNDQVDPDRIYVTGLSMGGYGTFDYLVRYPNEVAAAMPVCGGGDNEKLATLPELKGKPVWIFHGDADGAVNVNRSRGAYKALQQAGAAVKYTEYPGVSHFSWPLAYHQEGVVEWLFSQHR